MEDKLLKTFFEKERWENAINKGVVKEIDKGLLKKLCTPQIRMELYKRIKENRYSIMPPHEAQIPKDDGTMRTVYVNEGIDRVILSIINDMFFELCSDMVHPRCVSYQKGIGCGKVVQEATKWIATVPVERREIGLKADLSKYFDSVPIQFIDEVFDKIEERTGKSKILDIVREYYHMDYVFDMDKNLIEKYTSLRQGCAVAAFLADAVLYDMDEAISSMDTYYIRYSDDILIVGGVWEEGAEILKQKLYEKGLILNPKKVETLYSDKWFKFLGFNIKRTQITLSKTRVKRFQKEIESRTVKNKSRSQKYIVNRVNDYLYKGNDDHSWATNVLPIINVEKDIDTLNEFVMDCIRGSVTGKKRIGGIGSVQGEDYTIQRGKGRNVASNRSKTEKIIEGYMSLRCMRKAILTSREAYNTLVMQL